jgi:hypothetical protein
VRSAFGSWRRAAIIAVLPAIMGINAAWAGAAPAAGEDDADRGVNYEIGGASFTFMYDAAFGWFSAHNTGFGAGTAGAAPNGARKGSREWLEGYVHPVVKAASSSEERGRVYGLFSVIAAATRGDGDAGSPSTTSDRPERTLIEDFAVGWKSAELFEGLGRNAVDVSVGRQSFSVGDGFLIFDGTSDGGPRAMDVLGHRTAFQRTAILKLNTRPVRADLFHLETNVDQSLMLGTDLPASELIGANLEWFDGGSDRARFDYDERRRYVGVTALYFPSADSNGSRNLSFANGGNGSALNANRDGLKVASARFGGALLPQMRNLSFFGEYAVQRNDDEQRRVQASAWYVEPQYAFTGVLAAPRISYRYAHFSGDGEPGDRTDRSWDPLFPDTGPRSLGSWTLGEIYGRYTGLGNSNLNAQQIQIRAKPDTDILIGALLYRLEFDKPRQTTGVTSSHIMDEVDIYVRWSPPIDGLSILPLVGAGIPRAGLRQQTGTTGDTSRTLWLGEIIARYKF